MTKQIVLYFSVYGTAKHVAEEIARQTGADLCEIKPNTPYDLDRAHYDELAALTEREREEDVRPDIEPIDLSGYDTVYLGYPIWWYTLPMALYTFLENTDLSGKTIAPFNTHMGSGDGGTYETIRELTPGASVLPGLPVEMSVAEGDVRSLVVPWLSRLTR